MIGFIDSGGVLQMEIVFWIWYFGFGHFVFVLHIVDLGFSILFFFVFGCWNLYFWILDLDLVFWILGLGFWSV